MDFYILGYCLKCVGNRKFDIKHGKITKLKERKLKSRLCKHTHRHTHARARA